METMLTYNSYGFARILISNLQGETGLGFYRLIIQTRLFWSERKEDQLVKLSDINGELSIMFPNGDKKFVGRTFYRLSQSELKSRTSSHDDYLSFEIELDRVRIEAIEDGRKGGDFTFEFTFKARGMIQNDSTLVESKLNYQVNQSTWIKVLGEMKYRKTLLLEIPLEMDQNTQEFNDVVKYLKEAQNFFVNGRYRDSVGTCRDVLDSLNSIVKDERLTLPEELKSFFSHSKDMDKSERIKIMLRAIKTLTHPARHVDEVSRSFDWNMVDSKAVLAMTAALIQMTIEDKVN